MKTALITAIAAFLLLGFSHPASARTRVSVFFGTGYYVYPAPTYYYDYPPYYPSRYLYAPPPMAVAPPPPVVVAPPPVTYVVPETAMPADQESPTYTDGYGRTCREYKSNSLFGNTLRTVRGTACLQPDGTWRVVR